MTYPLIVGLLWAFMIFFGGLFAVLPLLSRLARLVEIVVYKIFKKGVVDEKLERALINNWLAFSFLSGLGLWILCAMNFLAYNMGVELGALMYGVCCLIAGFCLMMPIVLLKRYDDQFWQGITYLIFGKLPEKNKPKKFINFKGE